MKSHLPVIASVLAITLSFLAGCAADPLDSGATTSTTYSSSTEPSTSEPPLGAGPYPIATLKITLSHPDIEPISYTVSCLGDTATVIGDVAVADQIACLKLADAETKTRLVNPPTDRICTEQYGGPDEASVRGTFDGSSVNTVIDRTNGCGIDDWDRLMAGVLPPAIGVTE